MTVSFPKQDRKVGSTPDEVFCDAFAAARTGYSDVAWESLAPQEKTQAIYREMRRLDQTRTAETVRSVSTAGACATDSLLQTAGG